jgi:RNA polymerase sigma factor (sigma-70 family)
MQLHSSIPPDLVRLFDAGTASSLSEWQLLERFVSRGDEPAFEALVARLGPMVLGTCRRMLADPQDADDAFQATFLVLLRKARSLGPADAIAAWLHGVAVRVAARVRADAARRRRREPLGVVANPVACADDGLDPDVRQILDEEINRLPCRYKDPVVLCYLEGLTHEEAARRLSWPVGSVKGRLARARSLLGSRLTRRGVASSAGAAGLALLSGYRAEASVPAPLVRATCKAASQLSAAKLSTVVLPASVASLFNGVLSAMLLEKLRLLIPLLAVSGAVLTGAGVLARQQAGRPTEPIGTEPKLPAAVKAVSKTSQEFAGASFPRELRTERAPTRAEFLYHELIEAARASCLSSTEDFRAGQGSLLRVYQASRRLMDAQRDAATSPEDRARAVQEHIDRIRSLESRFEVGTTDRAEAAAILAEAQLWLAQAKSGKETPEARKESHEKPSLPAPAPGSKPGKDARSLAVLAKLEEPVAMSFANETPLEDILKYIKQATTGPNFAGIPIYVDPIGLQEAERTLNSTVQIDLEGVPLRRTLQLALKQLGLAYFVDDGVLCITSQDAEQAKFGPSVSETSPFQEKVEQAERGELTVPEMREVVEVLRLQKELRKALEAEPVRDPRPGPGLMPASNTEPLERLVKELRELIGVLRSEREKAERGPTR